MIRFLRLFVLAAMLAVSLAPGAMAIEVTKVDSKLFRMFRQASPDQAAGLLAGYTVLARLKNVQSHIRSMIPISTVAVLYFAPNGTVLGWSGKSNVVEKGVWQVKAGKGGNDLCLFFDKSEGRGFCTILGNGRSMSLESTKGNPFGLKANGAVPFELGFSGQSLVKIAQQAGI